MGPHADEPPLGREPGHRLLGVAHEVEQRLQELVGVALDLGQLVVELEAQLAGLAGRGPEPPQPLQPGHQLGHAHAIGHAFLDPSIALELADDLGGAPQLARGRAEQLAAGGIVGLGEQLQAAQRPGEGIVELVRHDRGHHADRGHALGVQQLGAEHLLAAEVPQHADHCLARSPRGRHAEAGHHLVAVGPPEADLLPRRHPSLTGLSEHLPQRAAVERVGELGELVALELLLGPAEQALARGVARAHLPSIVQGDDGQRRSLPSTPIGIVLLGCHDGPSVSVHARGSARAAIVASKGVPDTRHAIAIGAWAMPPYSRRVIMRSPSGWMMVIVGCARTEPMPETEPRSGTPVLERPAARNADLPPPPTPSGHHLDPPESTSACTGRSMLEWSGWRGCCRW